MEDINAFEKYLRNERNLSEQTIIPYKKDLMAFKSYLESLEEPPTWQTLTADVVRNWIIRQMDRGLNPKTVNHGLSALRTFYKFLLRVNRVQQDPVHHLQGPKTEKNLPSFIKESEMDRLLDGNFFPDDFEGMRDRLILLTFYSTGMRLSELVGLNTADADLRQGLVKVTGKRNKQRIIPFGRELHDAFEVYLKMRGTLPNVPDGEKAFFVEPSTGRRITKGKVEQRVREYLSLVSTARRRSPHTLRHTFATTMLNHQADLQSVKELLGHESLATTEIYTHTSLEELKQKYNQAHPRAKKNNDYGD